MFVSVTDEVLYGGQHPLCLNVPCLLYLQRKFGQLQGIIILVYVCMHMYMWVNSAPVCVCVCVCV